MIGETKQSGLRDIGNDPVISGSLSFRLKRVDRGNRCLAETFDFLVLPGRWSADPAQIRMDLVRGSVCKIGSENGLRILTITEVSVP